MIAATLTAMRLGALVIALAATAVACRAQKASDTAWPAASTTGDDGGESIEPHPAAVAAAVETSKDEPDEDKPAPAAESPKAETPAATETPAAAAAPTDQPPQGEVIISEEIIIEIEE